MEKEIKRTVDVTDPYLASYLAFRGLPYQDVKMIGERVVFVFRSGEEFYHLSSEFHVHPNEILEFANHCRRTWSIIGRFNRGDHGFAG